MAPGFVNLAPREMDKMDTRQLLIYLFIHFFFKKRVIKNQLVS